jgi:hypothetical protein
MPRLRCSVLKSSCIALVSLVLACGAPIHRARAGEITINRVNTLDEMWGRLKQCWQSPHLPEGHPGMQITAMFTFQRDGQLFGKPRITFESPDATEADSIIYRTAIMEALQRCSPMPFTPGMGNVIAGHPLRLLFDDRRNSPKPVEKRA